MRPTNQNSIIDTIAWGHIDGFPWLPVFICDPKRLRPNLFKLGDQHKVILKDAIKFPDRWHLVYWLGSFDFSLVRKGKNLIRPWNGNEHSKFLKGTPLPKLHRKRYLRELNKGIEEAKKCLGSNENPDNKCKFHPILMIPSDLDPDLEPPASDFEYDFEERVPYNPSQATSKRKLVSIEGKSQSPQVKRTKPDNGEDRAVLLKKLACAIDSILRAGNIVSRREIRKECEVRLNTSLKNYKNEIKEISDGICRKIEGEKIEPKEGSTVKSKSQPGNLQINIEPQATSIKENSPKSADTPKRTSPCDEFSKSMQLDLNELLEIQLVLEMEGYVDYKVKAIQRMISSSITRKQVIQSRVGLSITKLRKSKTPELVFHANKIREKWTKEWL